MNISQMALMHEGDRALNIVTEGKNQRIGVVEYTTSQDYANIALANASIHLYSSAAQVMAALVNKEIEYYIADSPAVWYYTSTNIMAGLIGYYVPMSQEKLAWVVKKDNAKLKQDLDLALEQLEKNLKAQEIIAKWIKFRVKQSSTAEMIQFD